MYHENFGHITEDCIALRKDISYPLSNEYLKEILGRSKERSKEKDQDPHKILENRGSLPAEATKIFGTSYSAAKRYAEVSKKEKEVRP